MIAEVASTPDLPEGAEKPLTCWILSALQFKPYLIDRYVASVDKEIIAINWMGSSSDAVNHRTDLISRWTRGPEPRRRETTAYAD
jgi:hypothetical protein